ncbi:MAG: T9SS type A sorting domain-containing protein [Flavobacteriales bacterium]|nr:T9SS type A sorting domain-containing protein [Flavobacteriales bacterium]
MKPILLGLLLAPLSSSAFTVSGLTTATTCGNNTGSIDITALGGTPPYTYAWADGPITEDRTGLAAGAYSVVVTDDLGETGSWNGTVAGGTLFVQTSFMGGFACPGESNGSFVVLQSMFNGTPPYEIQVYYNGAYATPSGTTGDGDPIYYGLAEGEQFSVSASDAGGCSGSHEDVMYGPFGIPISVSNIVAACNGANGSVSLDNSGDWPANIVITDAQGQQVYQYDQVSSEFISGLLPGEYTIMQFWTWSMNNSCAPIYSSFTVPDLGPFCGNVHGTSWYDLDADCVRDVGEVGVPYSVLQIEPGDQYVLTGGSGEYSFNLVNGSYTMAQLDPTLIHYCPVSQPVPFVVNTSDPVVDFANGSTVPLDLVLYTVQGVARPGFTYSFSGTVRNPTPQVSGPVNVTAEFEPTLIFLNASPTPASVVGNSITWNLGTLSSFGQTTFNASFTVPVTTPLGTVLTSSLNVSNTLTESTLANNVATLLNTVIGSYDPNDKVAITSTGASEELYFINEDEWIDYTIRFQNTGTASAIDVVVTDTIADELDMATFEQGAASHPFEVSFKPGKVVEWRFADINLPDSNANEAASHGMIGFRMRPRPPLLPGNVIENIANIYFDFNPPVITEPSVLVAELSTGVNSTSASILLLVPNPASDRVVVSAGGATIADLRIFSMDGREVMRSIIRNTSGVIDIAALPSGPYMVVVAMADDRKPTTHIIKL